MECFLFNRNEDYMRILEERLKVGVVKLCEERFSRDGRLLIVSFRNYFLYFWSRKLRMKNDLYGNNDVK